MTRTYAMMGPVVTAGPAAPTQAAAAGLNTLVFEDDFTTTSTVYDTTGTQNQAGYKWYANGANQPSPTYFQVFTQSNSPSLYTAGQIATTFSGNTTGAGSSASPNGGVFKINGISSMGYNGNFQSVPASSNKSSGFWKYGYFEVYFAADATTGTSQAGPAGPAVWSYCEGAGAPTLEIDFMECYGNPTVGANYPAWAIHDWTASVTRGNREIPGLMDSNWHTVGCLWEAPPAGGGSLGKISIYYDNVLNGTPVTTGTGGTMPSFEAAGAGIYLALGTGVGCPIYIDWVRIWQAP